MTWLCVQDGAREHYAIPRALHRERRLALFATEFWARPVARRMAHWPMQMLGPRWHPELDGAAIVSWNWQCFLPRFSPRVARERNGNPYEAFVRTGRRFSERVGHWLARHKVELKGKVVFSYDTTALELFRFARARGAVCVLGQMDPSRIEFELVREEEERWPGWALRAAEVPEDYLARREQEWALADRVVVNSKFCGRALLQQGVPEEKLAVVPLAYEASSQERSSGTEEGKKGRPIRVLFLGQVILRKGIQYLIEAAKLLRKEYVVFDVVGPIGISNEALKRAPSNVIFHGRASREKASKWYRRSDVFVLPTLSDGFALTQLEAMAHGLPVIATPNCGEVVTHGEDGFIVPIRDAAALAGALNSYLANPAMLAAHGGAALRKLAKFSLESLAQNLKALEKKTLICADKRKSD